MKEKNTVGLDEIFGLFEESLDIGDIYASKCLAEISAEVVKQRVSRGYSQKEFAQLLDVSQGMVSRWEGGDYNFTIKGLAQLAEKLNMELTVSLKKHSEQIDINYIENTNYAYAISGKRSFVSNGSNVINFSSRRSDIKMKEETAKNSYINETMEM